MRNIKNFTLVALALTLPFTPAYAEETSFLQVKARQVSTGLWQSIWQILRGESPLQTADLSVTVLDESGRPMRGASVLVGQRKGDPFADNTKTTDSSGQAIFADEKLRSGQSLTVTISRQGYTTVSLAQNTRNNLQVRMQKLQGERDNAFLSGKVTGFPTGYGSTVLELGIFIPAFRPESLTNFDPQQFISSYKEKIDVFGEREVPGNLILPPQRKRYGLIPISLSKPEFTMPLQTGTRAHMAAIAGAVGISDAMNAIKNKDFLQALNLANLTHVGWTNRRVDVARNERFDLAVSHEIAPKAASAKLSRVPAKTDAIALALFDPAGDGGDFVPLDVKAMKAAEFRNGAGTIRLGLLKQRRPKDKFFVFSGLLDSQQFADNNAASRWIVGSLQEINHSGREPEVNASGWLLPIQSSGVDGSRRDYRFTSPANPQRGLMPDFVLVNIVSEKQNTVTQGKTRNVLWSAVLPGNASRLTLPDLGRPVLPAPDSAKGETFHWEVIAVKAGSAALNAEMDIQSALRDLQHVSTFMQKY